MSQEKLSKILREWLDKLSNTPIGTDCSLIVAETIKNLLPLLENDSPTLNIPISKDPIQETIFEVFLKTSKTLGRSVDVSVMSDAKSRIMDFINDIPPYSPKIYGDIFTWIDCEIRKLLDPDMQKFVYTLELYHFKKDSGLSQENLMKLKRIYNILASMRRPERKTICSQNITARNQKNQKIKLNQ